MGDPDQTAERKREVSPELAIFLGWIALAATNAIFITAAVPRPPSGVLVRVLHHLFDAGHLLALGALSTLLVAAFRRVRPRFAERGLVSAIVISLVALGAGSLMLGPDLDNLSSRVALQTRLAGIWPVVILNLLVGATSLGITLAWILGRVLARPLLRWLSLVAGIAAEVANELILKNDYEGGHFFLAWAAAVLIGASLEGAALPERLSSPKLLRPLFGLLAVAAFASVGLRPSTNVLLQLYTTPGSVLVPFLARVRGRPLPSHPTASIPPEQLVWFSPRIGAADVQPTEPRTQTPQVVIFLGIDSVRTDVFETPEYLVQLPELARLKATGVYFSKARSPGPGTVFTYSALFSGRYFSQMYWSEKAGTGIWPWQDPSPRFPDLLGRHGVTTVDFASILWFTNEYGVTRGFAEETNMDPRRGQSNGTAAELVNAITERLEKQGDGSLFVFAHFMDAHYPYDRGSKIGTPKERFVSELAIVDKEIARLGRTIEKLPLARRTTLIVTADHGEGFGDHNTIQHGTTLYEELLRVPLIISTPGVSPRAVGDAVSLIDIGPTVLDLFGLPTPGQYMGQSLVPYLRGQTPKLTRPILAEGRLKRTLLFPDGYKVITDERHATVELYNLNDDPKELHNLALEGAAEAEPRVGALDAFFEANTLKRPGYTPPFRP